MSQSLLPALKSVLLHGFRPIFIEDVRISIDHNMYLLLGGNGLGKSTILQSIVYCLAGPADETVVDKTHIKRRWDKTYFKERLEEPDSAYIEVEFFFGDDLLKLKRGFKSNEILFFSINDEFVYEEKSLAKNEFSNYLSLKANYSNVQDFNFIVHQLCYLSEQRENIAWDYELQLRILMQVLADSNRENEFREYRKELMFINTQIRHRRFEFNKVKKRLDEEAELTKKAIEGQSKTENRKSEVVLDKSEKESLIVPPDLASDSSEFLQRRAVELHGEINNRKEQSKVLNSQIRSINANIHDHQQEILEYQNQFVFDQLNNIESKESRLALHKLIHHMICPICGRKSRELYQQVQANIRENKCGMCGTENFPLNEAISPGLEADLAQLLSRKFELESELNKVHQVVADISNEYDEISFKLNTKRVYSSSSVIFVKATSDQPASQDEIGEMKKAMHFLEQDILQNQQAFDQLQSKLDTDYLEFNSRNVELVQDLKALYEKYATKFLGIKCELDEIESPDKFLDIKLFVPKFNNIVRSSPESCSEAQRFFLDIAFRLALIEFITKKSRSRASFYCETPENALDISYLDTVAHMFEIYSKETNNLLVLSSNIQNEGIAYKLLTRILPKHLRNEYYLNLFDIGNLSEIQSGNEGHELISKQLNKINND